MPNTELKQLIQNASAKPRQLMVETIDTIGNKLGVLCSDAAALNALIKLFQGTILETAFSFFVEEKSVSLPEVRAVTLKALLVADAMRLLQFFIYADNVVKDSELEAVYHLYKPLANFCAMTNSDYDRFDNLERSAVLDFLHFHKQ